MCTDLQVYTYRTSLTYDITPDYPTVISIIKLQMLQLGLLHSNSTVKTTPQVVVNMVVFMVVHLIWLNCSFLSHLKICRLKFAMDFNFMFLF